MQPKEYKARQAQQVPQQAAYCARKPTSKVPSNWDTTRTDLQQYKLTKQEIELKR